MKGIMRESRGFGMSRRPGLMVMAAAVVMWAGVGSDAAPIHHSKESTADVAVFNEWSKYLLAGPTKWVEVEHPPVTAAVESAIWKSVKTDPGGTDPMVDFLLWKQSLDPTRFAHYHPKLAPVLHKISLARSSPTVTQQVTTAPTTTSTGGTASATPTSPVASEPQTLNPPASPEPSTLLLAVGMAAWAILRARSRRRDG
jgi:hypothetical protein